MNAVIITGASGFIGFNLLNTFITKRMEDVIAVDNESSGFNIPAVGIPPIDKEGPRVTYYKEDITRYSRMKWLIDQYRPKAIINLAAHTHVDASIDNPFPFVRTNVEGTLILLQSVIECIREGRLNIDNFKFIQVSTDEVYGSRLTGRFKELDSYNPSSVYSATKAAADHLVMSYAKTHGLNVNITHCTNNYGPHQLPEKFVPMIIHRCFESKKLPIYGAGDQIREWLHVDDHCAGLVSVLDKGVPGEHYNFGSGVEMTNLDMAYKICSLMDKITPAFIQSLDDRKPLLYERLIEHVEDRPGHDKRYAVDSTKAKNQLGWTANTNLDVGLKKTILWYLSNLKWKQYIFTMLPNQLNRVGLNNGL